MSQTVCEVIHMDMDMMSIMTSNKPATSAAQMSGRGNSLHKLNTMNS